MSLTVPNTEEVRPVTYENAVVSWRNISVVRGLKEVSFEERVPVTYPITSKLLGSAISVLARLNYPRPVTAPAREYWGEFFAQVLDIEPLPLRDPLHANRRCDQITLVPAKLQVRWITRPNAELSEWFSTPGNWPDWVYSNYARPADILRVISDPHTPIHTAYYSTFWT